MPSEAINVDDIINQIRQQVPMSTLPSNGHTLLGTEVFDEAIGHINIRFEGDEQALSALDTAIKNVIKGDFIGVEGTNLLKWDKSDQGVKLNGSLLDTLDSDLAGMETTVGGYKFTREVKNGWDVSTSSAGLVIATVELDIVGEWEDTTSPFGSYRSVGDLDELLPTDTFTLNPTISVMAYAQNQNYSFICLPIAGPSTTYIGKWQIIMLDKAGGGVNKPDNIHVIISAQGF